MNEDHSRLVYITLSAIAGAISALAFVPWKKMTWADRALTVFVGFTFAIFVVPWIAADWAGIDIGALRVICGITYMGAIGSNILIPVCIRKLRAILNVEDAA